MTNVTLRAELPSALDTGDDLLDSMEDEEIQSIMMTLQRSLSEDLLLMTLYKIKENLNNDGVVKGLLSRDVVKQIVGIMNNFSSSTGIQKIGLELVDAFVGLCPDVFDETQSSDTAYRVLLKTLKDFCKDEEIQERGLKMFSHLLESETLRNSLLVDDLFGAVADQSLITMKMYQSNTNIQTSSCVILYRILEEDAELLDAFVEEKLETFLEDMRGFLLEASVLAAMFKVLETVAQAEDGCYLPFLLSHQVDKYVLDSFCSVSADVQLTEAACDLLMQLKTDEVVRSTSYSSDFLSTTLVPLMTNHPCSGSIMAAGLELFCLFCEGVFTDITDDEETGLSKQWCGLIFNAMLRLMDVRNVQIWSCKAIVELLKVCPRAHSEIGENIINNIPQSPLHTMCVGAILMYKRDMEVFSCACEALYWLAADHEQICENLVEKNAYMAVMDGIRRHFIWSRAVECGLRALRAMIIFHNANKMKLVVEGIQNKLMQAFNIHGHVDNVIIECISTIACLAEVGLIAST